MPQDSSNYVVELKDVTKKYQLGKTEVHALRGVSLAIAKGEFTTLVGESGSGKTTTLDIIGGLGKPSTGKLFIDGEDITVYNDKRLAYFRRKNIGFIFQTFNLIEVYTAYENIAHSLQLLKMPEKEIKKQVYDIMEKIGLGKFINHRPNELSGGQRQRVAIARALVKNPKIIIADEPTANLDSETGANILKLMQQLNKDLGATFIVATHSAQVVQVAKRVFKLRDGALIDSYTNK
ncbi:MAG: ABC transporter ATP-binding protein [Candidatus Brocadiae bacterium]|nr:ABC transporter ATP-binding protein [Candidatus Brocadiia bacterium]